MIACLVCNHVMLGNPDTCSSCKRPILVYESNGVAAGIENMKNGKQNGRPAAVEMVYSAGEGKVRTIEAHIGGSVMPIDLHLGEIVLMGHGNITDATVSNIDLTAFGAPENGVACYHAALLLEEGKLEITDAGSQYGTFLNGQQVSSNEWQRVNNGDELRLGNLTMILHFD